MTVDEAWIYMRGKVKKILKGNFYSTESFWVEPGFIQWKKQHSDDVEWGIKDNYFCVRHGHWNASWKIGL